MELSQIDVLPTNSVLLMLRGGLFASEQLASALAASIASAGAAPRPFFARRLDKSAVEDADVRGVGDSAGACLRLRRRLLLVAAENDRLRSVAAPLLELREQRCESVR